MSRKIVPCDCGDLTHVISVEADVDFFNGFQCSELYVSVMMNSYLPWYKRVWLALNYILKRDIARYQYVNIMIVKEEDLQTIRDEVEKVLAVKRGNKDK